MAGSPRLESSIERSVVAAAKKLGVMQLKLNVCGQRGWPDRLFLVPGGHPLFIEFKRPGEAPRPLQAHVHRMMERAGYHVEVVDRVDAGVQALRAAMDAASVPTKGHQVSAGASVRRIVP